ncbi:MAG: hypothetical protein ACLRXC_11740 [[Clostridium] leptum]
MSGRFVKIDRERFGTIPGVTDREYYTNSFTSRSTSTSTLSKNPAGKRPTTR